MGFRTVTLGESEITFSNWLEIVIAELSEITDW